MSSAAAPPASNSGTIAATKSAACGTDGPKATTTWSPGTVAWRSGGKSSGVWIAFCGGIDGSGVVHSGGRKAIGDERALGEIEVQMADGAVFQC